MKTTLKNNQIIISCDDPYEYDDLCHLILNTIEHYKQDHHYDEVEDD